MIMVQMKKWVVNGKTRRGEASAYPQNPQQGSSAEFSPYIQLGKV
jgi:hypothetical protein